MGYNYVKYQAINLKFGLHIDWYDVSDRSRQFFAILKIKKVICN